MISDGALLEQEAHRRGRIYLRRLSGAECSAIASEVLLGSSNFNDSSSSDASSASAEKTSNGTDKKSTYFHW